jgi:crotonobetainyl-CoA:carnitine CoA-transferase CaiB-like acyl-CoA transferase
MAEDKSADPAEKKPPRAPLEGVRVLDLGRVIAAPYASQMLGDYGAEVIKLERAGVGDDARKMVAGCLQDRKGEKILSETSILLLGNRNKKSLTIEFSKPEGQKLLHKLAAVSDVLIENFVPGTMQRFNAGYETLSAINPRLIYCSITGWGQTGPYHMRPGYDAVLQAATGFMSVTGPRDDLPGAGPARVGASVIDIATGMNTAFAVMLALRQREFTGEGQYIDICLHDIGIAMQADNVQKYLLNGDLIGRHGTENYGGAPARVFRTADGEIYIIAGMSNQFAALCGVLGAPGLPEDKRFNGVMTRFQNRDALYAIVEPLIAQWKTAELLAALEAAGVPGAAANNYKQVFEDPHTRARGMTVHLDHPLSDRLDLIASPLKMSKSPPRYARPPTLGEHTDAVLSGLLGMSGEEIRRLREDGVV